MDNPAFKNTEIPKHSSLEHVPVESNKNLIIWVLNKHLTSFFFEILIPLLITQHQTQIDKHF